MKSKLLTHLTILALVSSIPSVGLADGSEAFLANKCNKCHTIQAKGIEKAKSDAADDDKDDAGPKKEPVDLSGVGASHDSAWIAGWIKKEVEKDKDGKKIKHKKTWKGTDADLKAISEFLAGLKTPKK